MGARGPAPTPPAVQEARGRTNHHAPKGAKAPKLEASSGECPGYLKGNARWLWGEIAPALVKAGLLTVVGVHQLAALCEAFNTWRQYEGECERAGPAMAVQAGYRNAADRARADFTKLSARFGMDPASLGNVVARPPAEEVANEKRDRFFPITGGRK